MPSQTKGALMKQYIEYATGPPLSQVLLHPDTGEPIDLTDADTVTIAIAWSMPHGSYYTSPRDRIVDEDLVDIVNDPLGLVAWTPGEDENVNALTPPGQFLYQFTVNWDDGTRWILPNNTYDPLVIRARVGGRAYNKAPTP